MPCTSPLSNINYTSHYPTAHSKPQHTSHTAFQPSFHITPCLIWHQTIPHQYSTTTFHILHHSTPPYSPCTTPSFHIASLHFMPHLTLHDITFSIAPYCTYSTSHLFPHHSHIRMNKAQHPTSGIAKHSTSHQIPHHAV